MLLESIADCKSVGWTVASCYSLTRYAFESHRRSQTAAAVVLSGVLRARFDRGSMVTARHPGFDARQAPVRRVSRVVRGYSDEYPRGPTETARQVRRHHIETLQQTPAASRVFAHREGEKPAARHSCDGGLGNSSRRRSKTGTHPNCVKRIEKGVKSRGRNQSAH